MNIETLTAMMNEVFTEFKAATEIHPPFNSAHEGCAVLQEEVEELWAEVKKKADGRDLKNMHKETVQIAAMSLRLLWDIIIPAENLKRLEGDE